MSLIGDYFGSFLDKLKLSDEKEETRVQSNQITTDSDDGAYEIRDANNYTAYMMNTSWSYNSQSDLIRQYREISHYELVDLAIEDIVNEAISFSENEDPIELDLSDLEEDLSENIRNKVYESWENINRIMDLRGTIHRRFRSFYVDGRIGFQKVIDKTKPKDGIIGIIELDARFLTKIRKKEYDQQSKTIRSVEELFIYDESSKKDQKKLTGTNHYFKEALQIDPKTIAYTTSGLLDHETGLAISYLHKAIKPINQLRMMENALLVYRITRAPERRVFNIATSGIPNKQRMAFLSKLRNQYRNQMSFDPETGLFKDQRHLQTMQEDFWFPRGENGEGSTVDTLSGGQNLSDIEDVLYFQRKVYKSLNIPVSRLEPESALMGGRGAEISRDELKFMKFVSKVRKRFNEVFIDMLKTDLLLKNVMSIAEWNKIENRINFVYAQDMQLQEMRENEIMTERLNILNSMRDYIGKYISHKTVRTDILKQTSQDIEEEDKQIELEKKDPKYQSEESGSSW